MTNKEMAKLFNVMATTMPFVSEKAAELINALIDELDPPKPKLDRSVRGFARLKWPAAEEACIAYDDDILTIDDCYSWGFLEKQGATITPIRELKPGQVAVDILPVQNWPDGAVHMVLRREYSFGMGERGLREYSGALLITREEAERMGAGDE